MSYKMRLMLYIAGEKARIKADAFNEELRNKAEKESLEFLWRERVDVAELLKSERAQAIELKQKVVAAWKPERAELIAFKKEIAEAKKRKKNERGNDIRYLVRDAMSKDQTKTSNGAWEEFTRKAQSPDRPAFILEHIDGDVKYERDEKDGSKTVKFFTRKAFNGRYYRIRKNA